MLKTQSIDTYRILLDQSHLPEDQLPDSCFYRYQKMAQSKRAGNRILPKLHWYGKQNQFHNWATQVIRFDFGNSIIDRRPVNVKIFEALKWTLFLNLISLILVYLIGIPIGAYSALYDTSPLEKVLSLLLFILYAIPVFWLATLLIVFFTSSEYGSFLNWFNHVGIWKPGGHFFKMQ